MSRRNNAAPSPALTKARKLVALATEQRDALARGASTQFDWLGERRVQLSAELAARAAEGEVVRPDEIGTAEALQLRLAELDNAMQATLRERMGSAGAAMKTARRFRKEAAGYFAGVPRRPSFVDRNS